MRVLLLGPVELRADDREVALGGPKPKALLAALLEQPRHVVSVERLVSLIWDDRPPRSATALVHTYVSLLRRAFKTAGLPGVLSTRQPGYLLDLPRGECDVEAFDELVDTARRHEREQDPESAAGCYEQALALWRGPAFGGVDTAFARTHAAGLAQEHTAAEAGLSRCRLAQGRHGEAATTLTKLVAAQPLSEEVRGLLMRALYESGRQADALTVYREGRRVLLDELGMEPGDTLRELHAGILDGSLPRAVRTAPIAEPAPPATPHPASTGVVPRHLPPDIGDFTGQEDQLGALLALAMTGHDRTSTPLAVISGFGGAGKSTLAVHAAHRLRTHYPDGQLFADLRGADRDLGAHEVLGRFLTSLGVAGLDLPDMLDGRVELFRRTLSGRRLVIVLDNARTEDQVRTLLPGEPRCLVIITSRSRLTGLEGAEHLELGFLSDDTALAMLARIVGPERVATEPASAGTIVSLCGGLPLALRVVAAKLLARPHWPLQALATRLSDEHRRLDELAVGDLAVRSSLRLNYTELDDLHRRAFHLLTLLDLPDFAVWLAAPLLDVALDDAEDVVERLVDLRLLDTVGIDALGRIRYRFHDLVQLFGAEHATDGEAPEVIVAAVSRMLAAWTALVEAGAQRLARVTLGLRPRLTPATAADLDPRVLDEVLQDPSGWLKAETAAVVRTLERAHELGIGEDASVLIASLLSSPFAARNEFDGWQRTHEVALAAARNSGDRQSEAMVLAGLGQLCYEKDDFSLALNHFSQAVAFASEVGDDATLAVALVGCGTVRRDLAQVEAARADLSRAAEIAVDPSVLVAARYGLGAIARDHGSLADAVGALSECVELYRSLSDWRGEALALRGLSLCHRAAGELEPAVTLSRAAETLLSEGGYDLGVAYARQSWAKALLRQGTYAAAGELLQSALTICEQHRDRFGVALMTRTSGELALARGDLGRAAALLTSALDQWTELELPLWRARTLRDLAAAEAPTDAARAAGHWASALALFTAHGGREVAELAAHTPLTWHDTVTGTPLKADL